MPRKLLIVGLLLSSLSLSGCSVFYPNWGATSLPTESSLPAIEETDSQATSSEGASESQTPEPVESASEEPAPTQEPKKETTVEIIMAFVDDGAGYLTVVAQLPDIVEAGGECTFKFIGGSVTKTLSVPSEPSSDYTQCHPIDVELSELSKGEGVVTVSYSSEKYLGTSAGTSVVIP